MSASLFDYTSILPSSYPSNYLEYIDGNKQFGELKSGDKIYYYSYNTSSIYEIEITSDKILRRNKMAFIQINPIEIGNQILSKLILGPIVGSALFGEINGKHRSYRHWVIDESSICVNVNGEFIFGTNRETVLKYAKEILTSKISNITAKIIEIKTEFNTINNKLKNLK